MKKVQLQFMVVPELLATKAEVPDPVRVAIVDPEAIFLTGLLGESGRKLVNAGIEFYFTRPLADRLIEKKIAVEIKPVPVTAENIQKLRELTGAGMLTCKAALREAHGDWDKAVDLIRRSGIAIA